jgi:CheY-like chemotaxis protein
MPGMNGLELARNIREDRKINSDKLLVVMLTGLSHAPARSNPDDNDIQAILYKPISGKSLRQALQSALIEHLSHDGNRKPG